MKKHNVVFLIILVGIKCITSASATVQNFAGVTIHAFLEEHPTVRVIAKLLPEFENATGIKVIIEVIPFESMTQKARETLKQNSDQYDVYMDGWVNALEWASSGYLAPLDEYLENRELSQYIELDDFIGTYVSDAKLNGRLYGLPVYGESTFLYYRKDLFSLYGIKVPETMEEIESAARQFKTMDRNIYPITLRGRAGIHIVYAWASFLWGFGGRWLNEKGELELNTPQAIQAATFFTDLLRQYGPPACDSFGWMENRDLFLKGRVAMSIDATVNGAFNEDEKYSLVAGKVGYISTPKSAGAILKGGTTSLITHQMYINQFSKHKDAAFLFVSWATSKNVQLKSIEIEPNCGLTSKFAVNSTAFQEKFGAFRLSMLKSIQEGNPDYLPRIPEGPEIFEKIGQSLSLILSGKETAQSELNRVNHEINSKILNQ